MKRIKKLNKINFLSEEEALAIKGSINETCEFDNCGTWYRLDYTPEPPMPEPETCKCGCQGCTYEEGGPGFSLGMTLTGEGDGYDCTWYKINP